MTDRPSYQNPPAVAVTSANAIQPLELVITPGTPVYDTHNEVCGKVFAVTPAFCVMHVPGCAMLYVREWEDVAVGNVCPARTTLPKSARQQDRLDGYASVLREIEGIKPVGWLPVLRAARQALIQQVAGKRPRNPRKRRRSRRKGARRKGRGRRA